MNTYIFQPCGLGSKEIKELEFTDAQLSSLKDGLAIGRNRTTIYEEIISTSYQYLSRSQVTIRSSKQGISLQCNSSLNKSSLNNVVMQPNKQYNMYPGDILCLLDDYKKYNYKLIVSNSKGTKVDLVSNERNTVTLLNDNDRSIDPVIVMDLSCSGEYNNVHDDKIVAVNIETDSQGHLNLAILPEAKASSDSIPESKSKSMNIDRVKENLECSICFDYFALTHLLSCGHDFCYNCIIDFSTVHDKCPTCQEAFMPNMFAPNRRIDSIVEEFMKLNPEEYENWIQRVNAARSLKQQKASGISNIASNKQPQLRAPNVVQNVLNLVDHMYSAHNNNVASNSRRQLEIIDLSDDIHHTKHIKR